MSDEKLVNIARLMTTYNFEIEQLPNNLKCAQCKLVLKNPCKGQCGCRFCRNCVNDMMTGGGEFCPGKLLDCGESHLSSFISDYLANKKISELGVKCPSNGCEHECQLANMEEHLRECTRKSSGCHFCEIRCTQDKLTSKEIGVYFQDENRRQNEKLMGMIAIINREIDTLKQKDEASSREIEILKHEMVLKDDKMRSIMDQLTHVQNENKSIKNKIKLIKEEKADLADRVSILTEKIERETAEKRENDELDSARLIEHVNRKIAAVTLLIKSNKDELIAKIQSTRSDIGSINHDAKSIKKDIYSMSSRLQSIQALVGLGHFDASCVLPIDNDSRRMYLDWGDRESEYFYGAVHPYKYRLRSMKFDSTHGDALYIYLLIHAGPNDGQLAWPFEARVVITVTDSDRREACRSISKLCRIERPPDKKYKSSDPFMFIHSELKEVGVNLSDGVRVSCVILPGAGR